MTPRTGLLLLALMATAQAHAALWQVEYVNSGNVLAIFKHNPGGLNPYPAPYFEDIRVFSGSQLFDTYYAFPPYAPLYVPNDDSHMSAASTFSPLYSRFVMDFSTPLTVAGGSVGVSYAGISADGTWCRGEPGCYEWGPSALVVRSMAEDVPVPATVLLIVAALPALELRRRVKRRHLQS